MEKIFREILSLEGVLGLVFLSTDGLVIYSKFIAAPTKDVDNVNWKPFIQSITSFKEADLIFNKSRFYIRRTFGGYLLVNMDHETQISMVRLNCDLVMPTLKSMYDEGGSGKLGKLLKK